MAKPGSSPIRFSGATSPWEIEDTGWPRARAIVVLYLDPPEHALVLCCDEKTQIQALGRTQPGLPLKRGRGKTMTHDYKRNGVTTLFAALNMLTGQVLSMTEGLASGHQLHRHQEWLRFLKMIDRQTP